jgi:hypothetical protein
MADQSHSTAATYNILHQDPLPEGGTGINCASFQKISWSPSNFEIDDASTPVPAAGGENIDEAEFDDDDADFLGWANWIE